MTNKKTFAVDCKDFNEQKALLEFRNIWREHGFSATELLASHIEMQEWIEFGALAYEDEVE